MKFHYATKSHASVQCFMLNGSRYRGIRDLFVFINEKVYIYIYIYIIFKILNLIYNYYKTFRSMLLPIL